MWLLHYTYLYICNVGMFLCFLYGTTNENNLTYLRIICQVTNDNIKVALSIKIKNHHIITNKLGH